MKKIQLLVGLLFAFGSVAWCQSIHSNVNLKPLLFKNFQTGSVVKKDGTTIEALFNYNTDNQTLIYLENDQFMELAGLNDISYVTIDNKRFRPVGSKVYEITANPDILVSYSNKPDVMNVNADKSGVSVKQAGQVSNDVSGTYINQNYKNRNGVRFIKNYWLYSNGSLVPVRAGKQLAKALNIDKSELERYVHDNHTNFNADSDVIALIENFKKVN